MSEEVRNALADTATALLPAVCHPYYAQDSSPGAGFVRLERIEYPNPFGGVAHWNVAVILPQDLAAAERYIDEHVPQLRQALQEHLVVTSVVPQRIDFPGVGVLPCVFINGHREED